VRGAADGVLRLGMKVGQGGGLCLLGARNEDLAKEAFDRFLAKHPGHAQALVFRARALHRMERDEESLADYRAAVVSAKSPEPDLFQEASEALAKCGKVDEAVRLLGNGIEKLGPVPSLVLKAMSLEIATGRFDAALSRVDAMQKSAPRREPWMATRAGILEQAGRTAEARVAWEALRSRLAALPNLERGSHAMSVLAEQAEKALRSLASNQPTATPQP